MKKTVILKTAETRGVFSQAVLCSEYENMSLVTLKKRRSALRKLVKRLKDENVIINHLQVQERLFDNRLKIYNELSYKTVLPIISKICRQTAAKYAMQIPFEEICIVANPTVAYAFVVPLMRLSRLFTIVSGEVAGKEADELYFEHGCIIRQLPEFNTAVNRDAVVIRANNAAIPETVGVPVIDITSTPIYGRNVIVARGIRAVDDKLSRIEKHWGGETGLQLYELLGELPDENTKVDINKQSDRIFLLDTEKF